MTSVINMIPKEALPAYVGEILDTVIDISTSSITGEVLSVLPGFGCPGVIMFSFDSVYVLREEFDQIKKLQTTVDDIFC